MQLMCDALAVLGSRHGLVVDPIAQEVGILRFDRFTRLPACELRAGIILNGEEVVLPLTRTGTPCSFVDQRTTPCTVRFIGIHEPTCLRLELVIATPFRPRDADFSTIPVLAIELKVDRLIGMFRWSKRTVEPPVVTAFLEIAGGSAVAVAPAGDGLDLAFASLRAECRPGFKDVWDTADETVAQHDRLLAIDGTVTGSRLERTVVIPTKKDGHFGSLRAAWCTWSPATLRVDGELRPFRYHRHFADLDAVCTWARAGGMSAILANADHVDGLVAAHDQGPALEHLLAYSLHSWLLNTWWADADGTDARETFCVWEGSCYMNSTVDVEFTQVPAYLALWPELLALELDRWPDHLLDGATVLGEVGAGTRFLSHDIGAHAAVAGQIYSHDMAVEESANYLIMACAHWRRSGDDRIIQHHADAIGDLLRFLFAADTTGTGVPDTAVANTIDDACPAVQFGSEQVYLAVKTLAACVAGATMAAHLGAGDLTVACRERAKRIRIRIEDRGWLGDHYALLLEKSGELTNPWSGETVFCPEIPGWDAAHIFTANALAPLDMVGLDVGLDEERLRTDLRVAADRCLGTYGCSHSDYAAADVEHHTAMAGLAGIAENPGWISMNLIRDLAAYRRGVDLRPLLQRYWEWQVVTNTQEAKLFFETFAGNNLCWYPRGLVAWGLFEALEGRVIDAVDDIDNTEHQLAQDVRVPSLFDAAW